MLNIISIPIVGCKKLKAIVHSQVQGEKIEKKIWKKILNEIFFGRF